MPWDLFCRVIDNLGDIGVCWRLAADLAGRGQPVRLWTDDARALAWMAPGRTERFAGVDVRPWPMAGEPLPEPGEVVIEAFGCDPPATFVANMAARPVPAVWINLEYLSAEAQAERNHGLPSPQFSGPGAGLLKHFFFPGFTPASGGLLREPGLCDRMDRFDGAAWLAAQGVSLAPGERPVSLFCYPDAPVAELIDLLADQPTVLLATAGHASALVQAALGPSLRRGAVRAVCLPWFSQADYDHLLWSCTINWVRGEDSLVRAQWAGRPFVWQIYPQHDGADVVKLDALLDRFLARLPGPEGVELPPEFQRDLRRFWHGWNGWTPLPRALPDLVNWAQRCRAWRDVLLAQSDLTSRLQAFVAQSR